MDITANYELTPGECRRALRAIGGWRRILDTWIVTIGVMCGAIYASMRWRHDGFVVTSILFVIVAAPILIWIHVRSVRREARRMCVPVTVRLTSEAVEIQVPKIFQTLLWSAFLTTVTTSEFWLLYVKKRYAAIVPRRAFSAAEQAEIDGFLRAASADAAA